MLVRRLARKILEPFRRHPGHTQSDPKATETQMAKNGDEPVEAADRPGTEPIDAPVPATIVGILQEGSIGSLARYIVESSPDMAPFVLLDVGASGGIHPMWDVFGEHLSAYGFDPILEEVNRLNAMSHLGQRRFFAGIVGGPEGQTTPIASETYRMWGSLSSNAATAESGVSMDEVFNNYQKPTYVLDRTTLDAFCASHAMDGVDFVKIDVDGSDFDVLRGAAGIMADRRTLGLMIEAQFHGDTSAHSNTFANIDIFMRNLGYVLYRFPINLYSRAVLPGLFRHSFPSQTRYGQAIWGDAIYLRSPINGGAEAGEPSVDSLLKLAALFDVFELPDCAAEIITTYRAQLSSTIDCNKALDILAKQVGNLDRYAIYMNEYYNNKSIFFENK